MSSGSIPKFKFREGLELCEENAQRLMDKMNAVIQISEFLGAFYLGSIALEEYGKMFLIR